MNQTRNTFYIQIYIYIRYMMNLCVCVCVLCAIYVCIVLMYDVVRYAVTNCCLLVMINGNMEIVFCASIHDEQKNFTPYNLFLLSFISAVIEINKYITSITFDFVA